MGSGDREGGMGPGISHLHRRGTGQVAPLRTTATAELSSQPHDPVRALATSHSRAALLSPQTSPLDAARSSVSWQRGRGERGTASLLANPRLQLLVPDGEAGVKLSRDI